MMESKTLEDLEEKVQARVRAPLRRGQLTKEDSSKTQLGLLSTSNQEGAVYLLVEPQSGIVKKAKFMSYGLLTSIPSLDAFCEWVIEKPVEGLDTFKDEELFQLLECQGGWDLGWLKELAQKLMSNQGSMEVSEPIEDQPGAYQRKAKEDMNESDLAWLPISAPEKIAHSEAVAADVMKQRSEYSGKDVEIYNVQRDLTVQIKFLERVESSHRVLLTQFIQEACQSKLHPEIRVEEVGS